MNNNRFVKYNFLKELKRFRKQMGSDLFVELDTWQIARDKVEIAKEKIENLLIFDWVKFIAISGSVAAGTVGEDDDIDLLIVVKNNRLWVYRLFLFLKNLGNKQFMHYKDSKQGICANKLEANYILEEQALVFEQNFFSLHELICLIPVYNLSYYKDILLRNKSLFERYKYREFVNSYTRDRVNSKKIISRNVLFFKILNLICFIFQFLYSLRNGIKKDNMRQFWVWYKNKAYAVWQLYPKNN